MFHEKPVVPKKSLWQKISLFCPHYCLLEKISVLLLVLKVYFCVNKPPQSIHWEALWGVADSERWVTKWKPQTVRVQCGSVAVSQRHSVTVRQCDTAVWECESVTVSQCSVTVSPVLVPSLHRRVHLCFAFQPLWPPSQNLTISPSQNLTRLQLLEKKTFDPAAWVAIVGKSNWGAVDIEPGTESDEQRCDIKWLLKRRMKTIDFYQKNFRVIPWKCNFSRESCLLRFWSLLKVKRRWC